MTRLAGAVLLGLLVTLGAFTPTAAAQAGNCYALFAEGHDIVTYGTKVTNENVNIGAHCPEVEVCENPDDPFDCTYVDSAYDTVTGQFTFGDGKVGKLWPAASTGGGFDSNWVVTRPFSYRDPAGLTKVTVRATDDSETDTTTASFHVRRNAKITGFNSGPEDRLVNSNLRSSGRLTRLTDTGSYVPWGNKEVIIEFKAAGTASWVRVGSDVTSGTGYFEKTVRTKKDGHWRARAVRTNHTHGPGSRTDYVNVTNYASCSAVPASLRPLTRTDPGYEPRLDGDGDGLACE